MAQTTKPGALALPSGARTFGAPVPGKTNVLVGCLAPFSTRPAAANSIMNGVRLAAQDMAKELGPSVNVIVTCLDSRGDPTAAGAAMQALAARGAGEQLTALASPACLRRLEHTQQQAHNIAAAAFSLGRAARWSRHQPSPATSCRTLTTMHPHCNASGMSSGCVIA
jgi:hypothetical protein